MSVDASTTEPPPAALRTESFRKARPAIVGEDVPESPYPIRLSGTIQRGFGRGGRDLGCHTGTRNVFSLQAKLRSDSSSCHPAHRYFYSI